MFSRASLVTCLGLWAITGRAADLLATLRSSNASLFADVIESDPSLSALFLGPDVRTVYAPIDSVLAKIPASRRALQLRQDDGQAEEAQNSYHASKEQSDASTERSVPRGNVKEAASDSVPSNRGRGRNQVIVEDNGLAGGNRRRQEQVPPSIKIFTGLGNSVNVVKPRIDYDKGSIYIIDGLFTVPTNLSNTLTSRPEISMFGSLLSSANLSATLNAAEGATFFIPSNKALSGNQTLTASTLQGYAVPNFDGYLPLLREGQTLKTLNGATLTVNITGGEYYINGSKIESANLILENGVAHVLDQIIAQDHSPTTPSPPQFTGGVSSNYRVSINSVATVALSAVLAVIIMV